MGVMQLFHPYSYVAVCAGFLVGIGITAVCVGLTSAVCIAVCAWIGMIRIKPLLDLCKRVIYCLFYDTITRLEDNIRESFTVAFKDKDCLQQRMIYMWHPHGVFAVSQTLHLASSLTDWPCNSEQVIKPTALSYLQWLPFGSELFEEFGAIPSDYHTMKKTLEGGASVSLLPGGMREMYTGTHLLKRRRGIFKMAIETGTPLVPVISVGEDKLYDCVGVPGWIQDYLAPYDICLAIPTLSSVAKWIGLLQHPLKDTIHSIVGKPIPVEKKDVATEADIAALRSLYIDTLVKMYKEETDQEEDIIVE